MRFNRLLPLLALILTTGVVGAARPNIVWINVEDMSAHFSCYGEKTITTPNVDRLAAAGTLFERAYVTAPVCSTSRSAMITGMYQTSIGAHHHRSGRGTLKIQLPAPVEPVPRLFQKAGYFVCNTSWPGRKGRLGKTDYNFEWPAEMYDGADWSQRRPGQPFFAQIMLNGGKLRGADVTGYNKVAKQAKQLLGAPTPKNQVRLPPYYPNDPALLHDWAAYLDCVRVTDHQVGEIVDRLKQEGVYDNTIIVFITDHGISHARGKQFCYEEGMHIPFVVAGPGIPTGRRRDLIQHIDMAALSLAAAGIAVPDWMQARNVFAADYKAREFVYSARDRCDETVDRIRGVRSDNFKYIRNFHPDRPYLQPNAYKDHKDILVALRRRHAAGTLTAAQDRILADKRPAEELYDLRNDPWELHNLATNPTHADELRRHRQALDNWIRQTGDHGQEPESEAMYDSDMQVYLDSLGKRRNDPERLAIIERNIATMKRWAAEGR